MNVHKYRQIHIPTGLVEEKEFTCDSHPYSYNSFTSRLEFLELINRWNTTSLMQAKMDNSTYKKVNWLYIAM